MSERLKCYVASPLGFSELTREPYEGLLDRIRPVVEPVNPFFIAGEEFIPDILAASGEERQRRWCAMAVRLYAAIEESAMTLGMVDGVQTDDGLAAELGYGYALHKHGIKRHPAVLYRGDLRQAGETENNLNAMLLPPYMETGGEFVSTLEAIPEALARVAVSLG